MRTLCILTIYNEMEYLPYKLKYCKENDLDLYIIDNMSNDGSWEWLQKNNIKSHRFDTQGVFNLRALQDEIVRTIHEEKPDWIVYNGCDTFPLIDGSLGKKLEQINKNGYNIASIPCTTINNTGEVKGNPFETYFYYERLRNLSTIHKYNKAFYYDGDTVKIGRVKVYNLDGIMLNYAGGKSKEERNETYARRQKAWDTGVTPKTHGVHYKSGNEIDWLWKKENLTDIRQTKYYKYIKQANFYK